VSDAPTLPTAAHYAYLAARTRNDDALLAELKQAARAAGLPPIWIAPEQASFLQILLRLARARDVVEVGTLAGYSAIWLARALPADGRLVTIEKLPAHARFAREWIARSDVAARIEVREGDAAEVLRTLPDASADAVFLDADKRGYPLYLRAALRILRPGGLLLADNAFAFGQLLDERPRDPEVGDVRAFNDLVAREPELQGVIVPLGDGVWVAVRR
jgi:predicted O-methyltransferase YrrM